MAEHHVRMMQLAEKGYYCSQILIIMGLEAGGKTNPGLVRAMDGLNGGCEEGSCTCGSLTGGCCLLAFFAGKGGSTEKRNDNYHKMMTELVRWFWKTYGFRFGGIDCMAITSGDGPEPVKQRCWAIMENVYAKVIEILETNNVFSEYENSYAS